MFSTWTSRESLFYVYAELGMYMIKSGCIVGSGRAVVNKDLFNLYLSIKIEDHPNYSPSKHTHPSPEPYKPNNPGP